MNSIPLNELENQLEKVLTTFIKTKLETIMKEELTQFLSETVTDLPNSRNGYYHRTLDTRCGKIDDLSVPRDRNGHFQTQLFSPYQRRDGWLEEAVIQMYQTGMSTRDIASFIEKMFGTTYSATTVSNITNVVIEDIAKWQQRPLKKRYSVIYLDGMYIKMRRGEVGSEVIYLALGVDEDGYRDILGFYVGGTESSLGWRDILQDIYNRGATEVLLGVFDGLTGLESAFKAVYPKADVQRCVVHKVRNTLNVARKRDQTEIAEDLKTIYKAATVEQAEKAFDDVKEKWNKKYPKQMDSWEKDLSVLLTFMSYPKSIQSVIYTTNWIERTNKEFRKRFHSMNSLPSENAAEKIVYLICQNYCEKWEKRKLRGFSSAKSELMELFETRYGINE